MSYFLGHASFVRMILLVLIVFLFGLEKSPAIAIGKLDMELLGREELVKWAGYGEEKLSTVVIIGKLLCHGSEEISEHPYPVSGATMAVMCGTSGGKMKTKKLISWTARSSTDSSGEFEIDVPSHLHAIPNLEKICHVRIVHLPTTCPCRGKSSQLKPIELASIGEGIRSYTTQDIHLMPHIKIKGQLHRTSA